MMFNHIEIESLSNSIKNIFLIFSDANTAYLRIMGELFEAFLTLKLTWNLNS